MLSLASERFERRLSEECSQLRHEIKATRSDMIAAIANARADLIKWAFLFWAGQLVTFIGLTILR